MSNIDIRFNGLDRQCLSRILPCYRFFYVPSLLNRQLKSPDRCRFRLMPSRILPIGSRTHTIQFWLAWLVVACILPAAFVARFVIVDSYEREEVRTRANLVSTARALMQAVDAEIKGTQSALQVLATSPYLASGDLPGFYLQARETLRNRAGNNIV